MNNIVRYFDGGLPMNRCNLRCSYCYVSQDKQMGWNQNLKEDLHYSIEHMKMALDPQRLGGPSMFNFVASGEPLLYQPLPDLMEMVTSLGHYARLVTNGTIFNALERIVSLPNYCKEHITLKFSMHYLELKNKKMLDQFLYNVDYIAHNNISYSVELCASDDYVPIIDEIKELCMKRLGALPQVVELRNQETLMFSRLTKMDIDAYRKVWHSFRSPLFDYETQDYEAYQDKFCYGGDYGITFSWQTGVATQCSCPGNKQIFNLFENPQAPLKFAAVGRNCPSAHCFTNYVWCALVGNYQDSKAPTYVEERDRIKEDGTHWLSPIIREVYSRRCSDFHEPYSAQKEFYIDKLMQKVYKGSDPTLDEKTRLGEIVKECLSKRGCGNIAIYGMGGVGKWIVDILNSAGINVIYGIDIKGEKIKSDIPVVVPNQRLPEVDAIIVSVYAEYNALVSILRKISDAKIVSVLELAE